MEEVLFSRKVTHPYGKKPANESFFITLKLGREVYFSVLIQSFSDFDQLMRTRAIVVKDRIINLQELTTLFLKNDALSMTDVFRNFIDTFNYS